ncbi:MAG: hypothetical protein MJY71_08135 [Bacteroidaceae bacterium]|nr:hypothetical protein [Bacteroidaceae bacterium]
MAITKEKISSSYSFLATADGAEWLASKLVPKYADEVTNDGNTYVKKDGKTICKFSNFGVSQYMQTTVYYSDTVSVAKNDSTADQYGFTTSNGVCVAAVSSNNIVRRILFTLDQNENTIVVLQRDSNTQGITSFSAVKRGNITVAPDAFLINDPVQFSTTVLASFPAYDENGEASYTPNAFFGITKEYSGVWGKKATINGDEYLLLDGWYLKD